MKKLTWSLVIVASVWFIWTGTHNAYADCPDGNFSNNDIICTGGNDTNGVNTGTGNDTVTTNATNGNITEGGIYFGGNGTLQGDGTINNSTSIAVFGGGNLTYSGSGSISSASSGIAIVGNLTINGSGSISGQNGAAANLNLTYSGSGDITADITAIGSALADVVNSGSGNISGDFVGIGAAGNVTNSGTGTVSGDTGIFGGSRDQTFTLSNGTIIGTGGTAVYAAPGNDMVSLTVSSVTLNGMLNGSNGSDTLELNGTTDDQAGWDFFQNCVTTPTACDGSIPITVTANGKSFTFSNFEAFINNMTVIIAEVEGQPINISIGGGDGGDVPAQTGVQPVCDGSVKVFRQANGDLDVYSGFDALPPNGYMVGRITQGDLAAGVRRFQDPGVAAQQGWVVEVTLSDKVIVQVFDSQGNPIGTCTP